MDDWLVKIGSALITKIGVKLLRWILWNFVDVHLEMLEIIDESP